MKHLPIASVSAVLFAAMFVPAAAVADTWSAPDPSGDVVAFADEDQWPGTVDGEYHDGDIVSSSITHGRTSVTGVVQHAELTPGAGAHEIFTVIGFKTPRMVRFAEVQAHRDAPKGLVRLLNARYKPVRCRGKSVAIDFTAGTVRATVPRRCLGKPRWVQLTAWTVTAEDTGPGWHEDDALSTDPELVETLSWGPRVYR